MRCYGNQKHRLVGLGEEILQKNKALGLARRKEGSQRFRHQCQYGRLTGRDLDISVQGGRITGRDLDFSVQGRRLTGRYLEISAHGGRLTGLGKNAHCVLGD